ncbi:hypothetical protein FA13DRAFT_1735723, partial [Coprinellus micaceus]
MDYSTLHVELYAPRRKGNLQICRYPSSRPSQLLTCPSYAPKSRPCIPKGVGLIEMLSRTGEGMTHQL